VATPIKSGALSIMLGAGAGSSTETNFLHSYGVNALVGMKIALSDNAAIRVDGISDWLANYSWKSYQSLHVGLSFYRHPQVTMKTVEVRVQGAPVQRDDSVSAEEQGRRRRFERQYRDLRDSLGQPRVVETPPASSAAALATMQEMIHFATDKSIITDSAKIILDAKVEVFRANPSMRIVILGNTDERASDAYNMGLGGRRAVAAKEYLVSKGIDPIRIEITSRGERDPIAAGTSTTAQGLNRRDEFRLLIASDYLVPPRP
jgi:peptidoglycan-associated lipoprotein